MKNIITTVLAIVFVMGSVMGSVMAAEEANPEPGVVKGDSPKTQPALIQLSEWANGVKISVPDEPGVHMFLWIFENIGFNAIIPYDSGWFGNLIPFREVVISEDKESATVTIQGDGSKVCKVRSSKEGKRVDLKVPLKVDLSVTCKATIDGMDMMLVIKNVSDHDWPKLASIMCCFHPGVGSRGGEKAKIKRMEEGIPEPAGAKLRSRIFCRLDGYRWENTYYLGKGGLTSFSDAAGKKKEARVINAKHSEEIAKTYPDHRHYSADKRAGETDHGLIIRESVDGKWVTGTAWEDFVSVQAGNPLRCMHLTISVGPLKKGESKTIRGKCYLFKGKKEDCLKRYWKDFPKKELSEKESKKKVSAPKPNTPKP